MIPFSRLPQTERLKNHAIHSSTYPHSTYIIFGFLKELAPLYNNIFAWFMAMSQEKADLSKGYQNPNRKFGVVMHFSKIIELKFGKKLAYMLCILTLF